jgi:uncharacterized protein (DUF2384 family)
MTGESAAPNEEKPRSKGFRKRYDGVRLSPEAAQRQGQAAKLAWTRFGDSAAAVAFLNTHHDALGGRPIDLAVASPEGLAAVEQLLGAPEA